MATSQGDQDTTSISSADIADDGTPSGGLVHAADGTTAEDAANPTSGAASAPGAPTVSTSTDSGPASDEAQRDRSGGLSTPGISDQGIPAAANTIGEAGTTVLPGSDATSGEGYALGSLANPGANSGGSGEAPSILTDPQAGTRK